MNIQHVASMSAIPSKIRVKLLSEAAEYVSVSHVVQRDFSLPELIEIMLPVLGKDAPRIRRILQAGTISTGDYRYRWQSLEVPEEELERVLQTFPGPDPARIFQPQSCFLVRFRRGQEALDLLQENAARKRLFARQSFWEGLLELARNGLRYSAYSYADKADVFVLLLDSEGNQMLRAILPLLRPRSAADRLNRFRPERIEWLSRR